MKKKSYKRVLTIAGSDSTGGAGIQADLKTFAACGCYGASAVVAVVNEDTATVHGVHPLPVNFVTGQIESILNDIGADAIKIGMLHSTELIRGVKETLTKYPIKDIVIDPVMVASSGGRLVKEDAIEVLKNELLPLARVITPNVPEAELLLHKEIKKQEDLPHLVKDLSFDGQVSVLLKAGRLEERNLVDVFYNAETDEVIELPSIRIDTLNTHGTGCTFSSAIAALLAQGKELNVAVCEAKEYLYQAIKIGATYEIGTAIGPIHHFYKWWE